MSEILDDFEAAYTKTYPVFARSFSRMKEAFGDPWRSDFNQHLEILYGRDRAHMQQAMKGYARFAMDAMRLQSRFNVTKKYDSDSYEKASREVYQNRDYMFNLYLPGILLSNYLWEHHYRQLLFYRDKLVRERLSIKPSLMFYDVGIGTGMYSIEVLRGVAGSVGTGIDLSPFAKEYTEMHVAQWGLQDRYHVELRDIIANTPEPRDYVQSIEVLEHLPDPLTFLIHLRKMLKQGGVGFITAAITAPNADHIYLYWSPDDVRAQIEEAGFRVQDMIAARGYLPSKEGEIVPEVAAFIVE